MAVVEDTAKNASKMTKAMIGVQCSTKLGVCWRDGDLNTSSENMEEISLMELPLSRADFFFLFHFKSSIFLPCLQDVVLSGK